MSTRRHLLLLSLLTLASPTAWAAPAGEELGVSTYRALLIGVKDYSDKGIPDLAAPVNDVGAIARLLKEQYGFTDIRTLTNPEATTRHGILEALDRLSAEVGPNDAVLLYYAGHGLFVPSPKGGGQGFWVPSDASKTSRASWISNDDVLFTITNMPARHVLVVSDACFSGSLLNERDIQVVEAPRDLTAAQRLAGRPSRWVIASAGEDEPARDLYKDGLSAFAYTFRRVLLDSEARYVNPESIFDELRTGVMDIARQTPVEGAMRQAGHEGGALVLVKSGSPGQEVDLAATLAAAKAEEARRKEAEEARRKEAESMSAEARALWQEVSRLAASKTPTTRKAVEQYVAKYERSPAAAPYVQEAKGMLSHWVLDSLALDLPKSAPPAPPKGSPGARYVLGDGTVLDNETGLMWAQTDSFGALGHCLDFPGAEGYASALSLGGYSDWRLPTSVELLTLYRDTKALDKSFNSASSSFWTVDTCGSTCRSTIYVGSDTHVSPNDIKNCYTYGARVVRSAR